MSKKYYAVKKGRTPGVYLSWEDCRAQVDGFAGAVYKGFSEIGEAYAFAGVPMENRTAPCSPADVEANYAYVDGSFNSETGVYGYGGFLVAAGERYLLQGCGDDPELAAMRNVAGEVAGSMAAMQKAIDLGLGKLTIYYDYSGIEMWATGAWKRNRRGTIEYYNYVQSIKGELALSFVKVKGHAGVAGNEEADRLAKEAVGLVDSAG